MRKHFARCDLAIGDQVVLALHVNCDEVPFLSYEVYDIRRVKELRSNETYFEFMLVSREYGAETRWFQRDDLVLREEGEVQFG